MVAVRYINVITALCDCNTCPALVLWVLQHVYLVRKDAVGVGGMIEDSQVFNLAIPAPVLDG